MSIIVFYHNVAAETPCPDGLAAAWVVHKVYGINAEYIGCTYTKEGEIPPEIDISKPGDEIIIVDFSFDANVLLQWQQRGCKITLLDHHEDKMKELLGIKPLQEMITFNNQKCGAILAWEHFFPNQPKPAFLLYIDDRDRWQKVLPMTEEVHAAVSALGRRFELFDALEVLNQKQLIDLCFHLGTKEVLKRNQKFSDLVDTRRWQELAGHTIPVVELTPTDAWTASEVCQRLYKMFPDTPFVACYHVEEGKQKWSLRSDKDGNNFDVAQIAKLFGGRGHRNAASFYKPSDILSPS